MSDLKQVLQELSDALPGIPEAMSRLRAEASALEEDERRLADILREDADEARESFESFGRSVAAVGEEGSPENQRYVGAVDEITPIVVCQAWAVGSAAVPGGALGPAFMTVAQLEMQQLRMAPVLVRKGLEGCREAMALLRETLVEGSRRLQGAGDAVKDAVAGAETHLSEGVDAVTQASQEALAMVDEQSDAARAGAEDVAGTLRAAQGAMESDVAAMGQAVQATGERLQEDVASRAEALRERLERALARIDDAWADLGKRMAEHREEADRVPPESNPLVEGLQVVLSPLRAGIDAVHEGARRLGLG